MFVCFFHLYLYNKLDLFEATLVLLCTYKSVCYLSGKKNAHESGFEPSHPSASG